MRPKPLTYSWVAGKKDAVLKFNDLSRLNNPWRLNSCMLKSGRVLFALHFSLFIDTVKTRILSALLRDYF